MFSYVLSSIGRIKTYWGLDWATGLRLRLKVPVMMGSLPRADFFTREGSFMSIITIFLSILL